MSKQTPRRDVPTATPALPSPAADVAANPLYSLRFFYFYFAETDLARGDADASRFVRDGKKKYGDRSASLTERSPRGPVCVGGFIGDD